MNLNWPLMQNNITRADLDAVIDYLRQDNPMLTQAGKVVQFEEEWSKWLGVEHSVFVNSGSSANQITMAALRRVHGPGEVIVPALTWVSDIAAVLQNDLTPVFVDIDPRTLGMDCRQIIGKLSPRTRAVFITHILGYNALSRELVDELQRRRHPSDRRWVRIAWGDFRGQEGRQHRLGLEFLLLLCPSHEHDRGRHGVHQ